MKVIAFLTQKGGTGKTTLAASVGVAAQQAGERVFLVDLDPQGSLASWGDRRDAEAPAVDKISPDKLSAALVGLEKAGYTLTIIDTQGVDTAATAAAMRSADLSLIPARPSALDIEAARPTMGSLSRLNPVFRLRAQPNSCWTFRTNSGRVPRPVTAWRARADQYRPAKRPPRRHRLRSWCDRA